MSFNNIYSKTMDIEGGYSFDPVDYGGETYKGISRVHNPNWNGWKIIDSYKKSTNYFENGYGVLYNDTMLDTLSKLYYRVNYWENPSFDKVDVLSPLIAEKLFDMGVNVGTGRSSKWLQSTLNLLNRNQKYYNDISEDGSIGPHTLSILEKAIKCNPTKRIMAVLTIFQGEHYKNIMLRDKRQERFVGWYDRLEYK